MKKFNVDVSMEDVGRVKNALDPIDQQDYVTKNYLEAHRYRMSATQATTLNTYGDLTALTSGVLPLGNYRLKALIKLQSSQINNGYGLKFNSGSAVVDFVGVDWRLPTNSNSTTSFQMGYSQISTAGDPNVPGVGTANTDYVAVAEGFFSVTTAGTIAIQFRSENSGAVITVGIGSLLVIERLP